MENNLVKYSRAGDVFHYRWAARRCLRLVNPKTTLRQIIIEGSKDHYWFEPLGEVFGISAKQVEELAREAVLKDWNVRLEAEFIHT